MSQKSVSKNVPPNCDGNFVKSYNISKIVSPLESVLNFQQNYVILLTIPYACCCTTLASQKFTLSQITMCFNFKKSATKVTVITLSYLN